MLDSGVTEGGKNAASFHVLESNGHNKIMKLKAKKHLFLFFQDEMQRMFSGKIRRDKPTLCKHEIKGLFTWRWGTPGR